MPRASFSNWKLYLTANEVKTGLGAAITAGPGAVVAALTALGTPIPGVGNALGFIVGLFGAYTISATAANAISQNKGMYIGVEWNGPLPVPSIGVWK